MGYRCIGQHIQGVLLAGICTLAVILVQPASAGTNTFDGSYMGAKTVTYGTAPECGTDGDASVVVKDGEIQYAFGAFPLKLKVADDGSFRGRARKGNRGGGQGLHVNGRVNDSALAADFVVNGVHGHVCSYHWALKKA